MRYFPLPILMLLAMSFLSAPAQAQSFVSVTAGPLTAGQTVTIDTGSSIPFTMVTLILLDGEGNSVEYSMRAGVLGGCVFEVPCPEWEQVWFSINNTWCDEDDITRDVLDG